MQVTQYASAAAFLDAQLDDLLRHEAENALIIGVAQSLVESDAGDPPAFFATVGDVNGPAIHSFCNIPGKYVITRPRETTAITAMAEVLDEHAPKVESVAGPQPDALRMAEALARLRGCEAVERRRMRIHQLDRVIPSDRAVAGSLRCADESDLPWVIRQVKASGVEIGFPEQTEQMAVSKVSERTLYLWENVGPVSMAAWSGRTPNGVRVNLVYTPPEHRGLGYASAAVAALSVELLQSHRFCCLYTDLDNPTSNAIYARIGYQPVSDAGMYELV